MNPRLSVVIPCYNHGQYVQEAIDSVRAAGRDDVEIIVVDDGSTDPRTQQEMERLATDPHLTLIRQPNGGLASARNAGITAARAAYILPLDADNRIRPAYIERGLAVLDASPEVGVVYGDAEYFGSRAGRWTIGPFDTERILAWNYIDACAVIRKSLWEQNGGYRRGMPVQGLEDWEFWLNTLSRGWRFHYVSDVMFDYRVMPGSMIEHARKQAKATEDFIADNYGRLYRSVWMQRQSVSRTFRLLLRLIRERLRDRAIAGAERIQTIVLPGAARRSTPPAR